MHCLANLDFEYELAGRRLDPALYQRWRHILRLVPEARQAECLDPISPQLNRSQQLLLPWGVTPRVRCLAPQQAWPNPEVIRLVNDKRFSHRLELELGIALPGARLIQNLDELSQAVEECPQDWVLKHPLGFSARERALGKRGQISDSARGWARKQLGDWSLVFEPWVAPRRDFSMHFQLSRESIQFLGHCQLVGDPSGVYRGNLIVPAQELPDEVLANAWKIARRVAELGYWGPMGIDAFEGPQGVRPLVEINARHSFGRLTLALKDWTPPDWCLLWWHPRQRLQAERPLVRGAEPGIYNLPVEADPDCTSGTVVVLAPTFEQLESLREGLALPAQ